MKSDEEEISLSGGNTSGRVVRIGNTVRKTTSASSPTIHRLLKYLESQGFDYSPRFLGIDEKNREILSYIDGRCEISALAWCSRTVLESAALMLKEMHDLTAGFQVADSDQWAYTYPDASRHEVVCHNDSGLYNLVIKNDQCNGIIDFDLAGPGPRLRDIAYAAYWLVPLSMHADDMRAYTTADIENGSARLKLFCKTYGIESDAVLLDMVSEVLNYMSDKKAMLKTLGAQTTESLIADGHLDHWSMEAIAFDRYRSRIEKNLP